MAGPRGQGSSLPHSCGQFVALLDLVYSDLPVKYWADIQKPAFRKPSHVLPYVVVTSEKLPMESFAAEIAYGWSACEPRCITWSGSRVTEAMLVVPLHHWHLACSRTHWHGLSLQLQVTCTFTLQCI